MHHDRQGNARGRTALASATASGPCGTEQTHISKDRIPELKNRRLK